MSLQRSPEIRCFLVARKPTPILHTNLSGYIMENARHTALPQSPPCRKYFVKPKRVIIFLKMRAILLASRPAKDHIHDRGEGSVSYRNRAGSTVILTRRFGTPPFTTFNSPLLNDVDLPGFCAASEKPNPSNDGMTTSKTIVTFSEICRGWVSSGTSFNSSKNDPGQP